MNCRVVASFIVSVSTAARAQKPPAVRPIGPIVRVSTEPLMSVATAREVSDGRVFVNDITAHRVLLFDSTLATARVIADSTDATSNLYGARPGALIPSRGDTTLFVDQSSLSMLVLDRAGKIVRVMAVPRPNNATFLLGSIFGSPGFDAQGRLVHRGNGGGMPVRVPPAEPGKPATLVMADSAPVVRVDLTTRMLDTVAIVKIEPGSAMLSGPDENGVPRLLQSVTNPLRIVDDWAVLPDGSIAVVRGRDFHVDWLGADGHWTSTPKMPFDWEHLDDDAKVAFIDSVKAATQARMDSIKAVSPKEAPAPPIAMGGGVGDGGRGGGRGGGAGGGGAASADGRGAGTFATTLPLYIEPLNLPDYRPPFTAGATRADAEGNLWIRTSTMLKGQPVYDIVNRQGIVTDRVQLPPFRTIAGFGHGVVYMAVKDSAGVVHLERARVR